MISDSTVALRELEGTVVTLVTFLVDSHSVVGGIFYAPAHIDWPLYLVGDLFNFRLGLQEVSVHREGSLCWAMLVMRAL